MSAPRNFEEIMVSVASLGKAEIIDRLMKFDGIKLDFSSDYLKKQTSERLQHILMAAITTKMRRKGA